TATPELYTLSLHDALPIFSGIVRTRLADGWVKWRSGREGHAPASRGGLARTQDIEQMFDPPAPRRRSAAVGGGQLPGCQRVAVRSEEHTSELQSRFDLVCR